MPLRFVVCAGLLLALGVPAAAWAQSISCESQDYRRQYCPTGRITGAQIISQTSNSPCVQGRTWGWDSNGIWVNQGCAGNFAFQGGGGNPNPPSGTTIACESRDYQQNYCGAGTRVRRAWVAQQQSQSPCIQGRTWGYDGNGVWVTQGCSAIFAFEGGGGGGGRPPQGNVVACESRDYQQSYCPTGFRVSRAWVAEQRSQSPCIQGQTWGIQGNNIWVSGGCSALFAFESR